MLARKNISLPEHYVAYGQHTVDGGYSMGMRLLSMPNPPTAVFITGQKMTIGFLKAAVEMGVSPTKDVSVVSFDYNEVFDIVRPNIPYVQQPLKELGRQAAEIMLKRIKGNYKDFPLQRQLKTELVIHTGENTRHENSII